MLYTNLGCLQIAEKTVKPAIATYLKQYSIPMTKPISLRVGL